MPWHRTNKVKPKPISVAFMFMLESAIIRGFTTEAPTRINPLEHKNMMPMATSSIHP